MPRRAVVVNDILHIKTYYTFADQVAINDYGFRVKAVTGDSLLMKSIIDELSDLWSDELTDVLADPALYYGMGGLILTAPTEKEVTTTVAQKVGHDAGAPLPRQVALIVKKQTLAPGPSGTGRVYLPFFGEGDNDDGKPIQATLDAVQVAMQIIFAPLRTLTIGADSVTLQPVIINRLNPPQQ